MKLIIDTVFTEVIAEPLELHTITAALTVPDKSAPVGYTCFLDKDNVMLTGLVPVLLEQLPPDMPYMIENVSTPLTLPSIADIKFRKNYLSGTPENPYEQRVWQEGIAKKALAAGRGIIQVGTGGGKTEIAALMLKWMRKFLSSGNESLFVVGDKYGLQQTVQRFEIRGLGPVGRVGGGVFEYGDALTVAIVDSLYSKLKKRDEEVYAFLQRQDVLMFDEVQHLGANSWFAIGVSCPAQLRYGLSGMPFEHPKHLSARDMSLMGLTGPVVAHVSSRWLRQRGFLAEPVLTWVYLPNMPKIDSFAWQQVYKKGIVHCVPYNSALASIAMTLYDNNFKTLFFVAHKEHGFQLLDLFKRHGYDKAVLCHGDNKAWFYQEDGELIEEVWDANRVFEFVQTNDRVLIVGTPFIDEGADLPSLNALIMGGGMKKYGRIIQRIGRGLRPKEGDNRVFVFDVWTDYHPFLYKHAKERQEIYEDEAYTFISPRELRFHLGFDINIVHDLDYGKESESAS